MLGLGFGSGLIRVRVRVRGGVRVRVHHGIHASLRTGHLVVGAQAQTQLMPTAQITVP